MTKASKATKPKANFDTTFQQLKSLFEPYCDDLDVTADTSDTFAVYTRHVMKNKQRLWFGGVRKNKSYVSLHLMPVYSSPELLDAASVELKKRLQGKSCFNFKQPLDDKVLGELRLLTKAGYKQFSDPEFIDALIGQR